MLAGNEQGLLLWRYKLNVQPLTEARFCFTVEDKNYSRMLFVTLELLLIHAHSRWLVRRPAIAASPML
jgi:hypothetical protein